MAVSRACDIQMTRCDIYGQEMKNAERILLLYDGLHYDAIAFDGAPEEFDQTVFTVLPDRTLGPIEMLATNLVKEQHIKRKFIDTANFCLRCGVCQQEAVEHAKETGHANFHEFR